MRDLPAGERPRERLQTLGESALSTTELLAVVIGTGHGDDTVLHVAQNLLGAMKDLPGMVNASPTELQTVNGIGPAKASRLKASLELGRRLMATPSEARPTVSNSLEAANLLMPEMMFLEQEQLRLILLDTRNRVLSTPTIYIGSLNTSVVRIGELFNRAIRDNAAALIVAHNHPSADPSPSPEDVQVTRQICEAGELLGVSVLDHVIIGRQRYVSLREKGLGFD